MLLIAVMIQTPHRVRAARRLRNANDERFSCRICYGDGQYSVSEECDHFYCGDCIRYALEAILREDYETAAAQIIQSIKATRQVAIDKGNWSNAWLLTGEEDVLSRKRFAAGEEELETIAGYNIAMAEISRKLGKGLKDQISSEDDETLEGGVSKKQQRKLAAAAAAKKKKEEAEKARKAAGG